MGAVLGTLTRVADYIFRFLFGGQNEEAIGVAQGGVAVAAAAGVVHQQQEAKVGHLQQEAAAWLQQQEAVAGQNQDAAEVLQEAGVGQQEQEAGAGQQQETGAGPQQQEAAARQQQQQEAAEVLAGGDGRDGSANGSLRVAEGSPHSSARSGKIARGLLGKRSRVSDEDATYLDNNETAELNSSDTADLNKGLPPVCRKRYQIAEEVPDARTFKEEAVAEMMIILWKVSVLRAHVLNVRAAYPGCKFEGQQVIRKQAILDDCKYICARDTSIFGRLTPQETIAVGYVVPVKQPVSLSLSRQLRRDQVQRAKVHGVLPVFSCDRFVVPLGALSCNVHLDEITWSLADAYTTINYHLQRIEMHMFFANVLFEDRTVLIADLIAAIGEYKKMCAKLRTEIEELGGTPLLEPKVVWKERFPDVKF